MMIEFKRLTLDIVHWNELEEIPSRFIFHTKPWLDFLVATQNAEPIVLEVLEGGYPIGYFTGLIVRKMGIPILGSPFPGWTTMYMGLNLRNGISRKSIIKPLIEYAFDELGCWYFEMVDRLLNPEDVVSLPVDMFMQESIEIDLTLSVEQLLKNMSSKSCRYAIRKAEKNGVKIIEATDEEFAKDYMAQLLDVFGKQHLVPTYDINRVRMLMKYVLPTGNLLLLRALSFDETCIATGIFPAFGKTMIFWGGASWRDYQHLCPNEMMIWHAMRYWKDRGMAAFDMGGGVGYKKKYGGTPISVPGVRASKYRGLCTGQRLAKNMYTLLQKFKGQIRHKRLR